MVNTVSAAEGTSSIPGPGTKIWQAKGMVRKKKKPRTIERGAVAVNRQLSIKNKW